MIESYCACGWRVVTPVPINEMPVDIVCAQCGAQIHEGIPTEELPWPKWARLVEYWWRKPEHVGVGDSFERMATVFGAKAGSDFLEKHGIDCGCGDRKRWMNERYRYERPAGKVHPLISWETLAHDTLRLAQIIVRDHPDVSGVAGCPRSGLRVAADLAIRLQVPLYEASREHGLRRLGSGLRLRGDNFHGELRPQMGPIVLVDDSTVSGFAISEVARHPDLAELPRYCLYAGSPGRKLFDGYVRHLELPHWFAWNMSGNGHILRELATASDWDGVLNADCTSEDDDDGERYRRWIETVEPIDFYRAYKVPTIISGRLERWRPECEAWLNRNRIQYGELVLFPGTYQQRLKTCMGTWKASEASRRGVRLFIESCPNQAQILARSGIANVVCTGLLE